jgi:hypothetical protein
VGAVDERFLELQAAALLEVSRESAEQAHLRPVFAPLLKASMDCLVRRIPRRQIRPSCPGSQDPEDAVEDVARIAPRAPAAISSTPGFREDGLDDDPLLLGQIHPDRRSEARSVVDPRLVIDEMRSGALE